MNRTSNDKEFRGERRTPLDLYAWIQDRYGEFDCDLAASYEYHLCNYYFTKDQSALLYSWQFENGFFNADFSLLKKYIIKTNEEMESDGVIQVVGLMPLDTLSTQYFREYQNIVKSHLRKIVVLTPRVNYIPHPDSEAAKNLIKTGEKESGANGGSMLLIWKNDKPKGKVKFSIEKWK